MAKVAVHKSHRGTNYIPRALRENRGSKQVRRPPSPELEDAEETYMFDGEEKTGAIPKRVRRKYTGGTPGRGKKGDEEDADQTGAFGDADFKPEGQYAEDEGSDTYVAGSPDQKERKDSGDKKRKKSKKNKFGPPMIADGDNDQQEAGSQRSKPGKKRRRSTRKNDEAAYESNDPDDEDFKGPVVIKEENEEP